MSTLTRTSLRRSCTCRISRSAASGMLEAASSNTKSHLSTGATRNYATTPEEAASSTPAAGQSDTAKYSPVTYTTVILLTAYPFSSQLQIIKSSFSSASKRTDSSHTLMHRINTHLSATAAQTDPTLAARLALFSRANRHRRAPLASPGSILTVKFYTNASRTQTNTFSGVLIAVRRRGVDTCFRLRNVLNKCGVEMMFNASSNMLADIEVVSRADLTKRDKARPGRMVRFRSVERSFVHSVLNESD